MKKNTVTTFYKDYTQARAHIAHKSLKIVGQKKLYPYNVKTLLGCKNKHLITNPRHTLEGFLKGLQVWRYLYTKSLSLLIVNTNKDCNLLIENFFRQTDLKNYPIYYCNEKWVGGLLTNWKTVSVRVESFVNFCEQFETFILQNNINFPSYKKMSSSFQGLRNQRVKRPDLIFLVNPNENRHVVEEAVSLKIPVIAITDSNTPLSGISFPIPGNSNSVLFVHYCLQWIARIVGHRAE